VVIFAEDAAKKCQFDARTAAKNAFLTVSGAESTAFLQE